MVTGHRQRDFIFTRATVVLGMYSYKIVKLTLSCIGILSFNSVKYISIWRCIIQSDNIRRES